ncbi:uncharacterized protein LOC112557261 [Pomacea canaliculata]|uniref:uncharacterized protein LOC112557261 n=1 Tax=Pomacea canaliculata TaxID=400727 RepID=UPI000D72E9D7|nr:uncharacterized protein LOC112557261 [Pomacea canaliculata]
MGPSVAILLCVLTSANGLFLYFHRYHTTTQNPDVHENQDPDIYYHVTSVGDLVIAVNSQAHPPECYVIDVTTWSHLLDNRSTFTRIKAQLETLISSHESKRYPLTHDDLQTYFKAEQGFSECRGHNLYLLDYTPSL